MKLCQSENEIIATELNPMCDAPKSGDFIAFTRDGLPCSVYLTVLKQCVINSALSRVYDLDYFIGWLPMPIYDPSHKELHDFKLGYERYEKLRKLNARQFSELYERNIRGENFDEMVDKL